jgi:hypothetical protein
MRTSKSSAAWKKRAALLLTVTALCTASSPFTSFAADPVTASEVNISVKGGTRGLTASGITPGKVYADASSWKEGAAGATNSVAIGGGQIGSMSSSASVRGQNSVAVGAGASINVSSSQDAFNSANATAIGTSSSVSAMQGTAVGYKSKVTGAQGTAIGEQSTAEAVGAATFGEGSHAKAEKSTALGTGANVGDGANNSVSLGSGNAERRLIHVADGVKNTDAATVGQLNKAGDNATKNVDDITMNTTDALNKKSETRSFKQAGLVPGKSNSSYSTAIGNTGFGNPSIGKNSAMSVAIGDVSQVGDNAERSTAIGYNSNIAAGAEHSVAIGESTSVTKKESVAVGEKATVQTQNAIAIGTGAKIASGAVNSIAIGGQYAYDEEGGLGGGSDYLVTRNAKNSTVIGTAGLSQSEGGVALGKGARVTYDADNSAALGTDSIVSDNDILQNDSKGVVSFGSSDTNEGFTRRLINVSDGVNNTDAATVGQLNKAVASATQNVDDVTMNTNDALNGSTETRSFKAAGLVPGKSNSNYSTAIGNTGFGDPSIGTNSDMSVAVGDVAHIGDNAERSTAIGYNSNIAAEAEHSVAIGESSSVSKKESVAVGKDAQVETQNAIAIGTGARIGVGAINSVAIGGQYEYDEEDGLGGGSDYLVADNAKNSTVIGAAALSQSEGGTALGEGARVAEDANDSVALGHGSYVGSEDLVASDKNGVVSVGTSADSDGNAVTRRIINVSDGIKDSDAATLGQLNKAMQSKTYTADGTLQHDIDTMKAGINSNAQKVGTGKLTNGAEDLTQGVNANTASIQKNSSAIQQNATAINENSNDIQRNATAIQQNTDSITSLNTHVRSLDQEVDSVGALSAALAGLYPIDYDGTGSRFQISAAAGTYDGKQAVALGGFYHANRDVMFSLGASSTFGNDRKAAGNIGVTFRVGPSANKTVDNNQNNDDIEMLKAEIQELKAEIRNLKSK